MKLVIAQVLEVPTFNPAEIIGKGWKFGPTNDQPAVPPGEEINLANIDTVSMLREGESYLSGQATRARLVEEGAICLPPAVGWLFFKNQRLIPKEWEKFDRVYFDGGPELLHPRGLRCAFCLCRSGDRWDWHYDGLGRYRRSRNPSAVLAK